MLFLKGECVERQDILSTNLILFLFLKAQSYSNWNCYMESHPLFQEHSEIVLTVEDFWHPRVTLVSNVTGHMSKRWRIDAYLFMVRQFCIYVVVWSPILNPLICRDSIIVRNRARAWGLPAVCVPPALFCPPHNNRGWLSLPLNSFSSLNLGIWRICDRSGKQSARVPKLPQG